MSRRQPDIPLMGCLAVLLAFDVIGALIAWLLHMSARGWEIAGITAGVTVVAYHVTTLARRFQARHPPKHH